MTPPRRFSAPATSRTLYEEISCLAYHFHWPPDALLDLVHRDRLRYVAEVGRINTRINRGG